MFALLECGGQDIGDVTVALVLSLCARQVFALEHSGVCLLCTWSILYTVMETLEDGIHCGKIIGGNLGGL